MNIRQPVLCFVMFVGILLLTSCGSVTPTSHPTAIPTIFFAATLTPQPTPTITRTVTASTTLVPSQTDTAPSAKETSVPLTEETQATQAVFPTLCNNGRVEQSSPNEKWQVLTCDYDNYIRKMVVENSTGIKWELNYKDFLDPAAKGSGVAVSADLYPLHWSPDVQYLYFTSYSGAEGGGTCFYGFGVQGLFRLNLQTGKVSTILALLPPDDRNGYEIAFSPTGRRFSYSRGDGEGKNSFHLVDVLTGEETTFPTEQQNGTFRWSPDGNSLAYSTSLCDFKAETVTHSFIKILNIADLSTRTIAQSNTNFLTIENWSEQAGLLNITIDDQETISIDVQKSVVIRAGTATP